VSDVFSTLELKKSSCSECAVSDKSLVSVAVRVSTTLLLCFYTTINMPQQHKIITGNDVKFQRGAVQVYITGYACQVTRRGTKSVLQHDMCRMQLF